MILPGTGRGTAPRSGVVEGACHKRIASPLCPSTMLRMVPLSASGEDL